jgi:hypothetical protein
VGRLEAGQFPSVRRAKPVGQRLPLNPVLQSTAAARCLRSQGPCADIAPPLVRWCSESGRWAAGRPSAAAAPYVLRAAVVAPSSWPSSLSPGRSLLPQCAPPRGRLRRRNSCCAEVKQWPPSRLRFAHFLGGRMRFASPLMNPPQGSEKDLCIFPH